MTPKGFKAWVRKAARGRHIIYFQGENIQANEKVIELRDVAMAAYESKDVILYQKRLTPTGEIDVKRTVGTFAYFAQRT